MQEADRIIAECMQDRLDMERHYRADRKRIDIVPCGFDPQELWPVHEQARRRLGLASDEFVVLQLGRIVPRKGIDNVIESLALLRDHHGIRARLLVVGGYLPEEQAPDSAELREHNIKVTGVVVGGMRTPFLLDRFPDIDASKLQDPLDAARGVISVLLQPSVIAEITILPMQETSWP